MEFPHLPYETIVNVLALCVLFANAFFLGSVVLAKVVRLADGVPGYLDLLEWVFVGTTLGLGLLAVITLPLGLLLPYDAWLYRCVHAVALAAGGVWWQRSDPAKQVRQLNRPAWFRIRPAGLLLWSAIGVTLLYATFLSLHALEGFDAQTMHLKAVMFWRDARHYLPYITGFDGLPPTVSDAQTQSGRLLFLQVALLGNLSAAGGLNVLLLVLGGVGVYSLGARFFTPATGAFAVLIYLTNPVLFRYYLWDVSDYPLNLCVFLALAGSLTLAIRTERPQWLVPPAILAGLLYGMKSYSVLQLALVALIALPFLVRLGWIRVAARQIPWFGLFAAPWLVHPWITFGNPVWPYLNTVFRGHALNPFWLLNTGTRPYFQLQPYFDAGCVTYTSALVRFWRDQLFPAGDSVYLFSYLLLPSVVAFAVAAWWRRIFLIPLGFAVGFLAVTLNTPQLFNKYMILLAAPLAPFLAFLVQQTVGRRERVLAGATLLVGVYGLGFAWDAIAWSNRDGEIFSHGARTRVEEPQRTLNRLPDSTVVFGNFAGMDNRYTHTYWSFRYKQDTSELLCDDWEKLWAFYKEQGVTHYLVQTNEYNEFYYAAVLPYADKFDPPLASFIRGREKIFEQNKEKRDHYLAANARLTSLSGRYSLYELR